jgi:hypothetical protein
LKIQGIIRKKGMEVGEILRLAQMVLERTLFFYGNREEWQGREGVMFCVGEGEGGFPVVSAVLGSVGAGKIEKYNAFAPEKSSRLAAHAGDLSSFQSRDPDKDQWGGAVRSRRAGSRIFSCSGAPELGDEAMMLIVALAAGEMTPADAEEIVQLSRNPYFPELVRMPVIQMKLAAANAL